MRLLLGVAHINSVAEHENVGSGDRSAIFTSWVIGRFHRLKVQFAEWAGFFGPVFLSANIKALQTPHGTVYLHNRFSRGA